MSFASLDDTPADTGPTPRFCTAAASRIPSDAQASMCMDFEDVALGPVADGTFFVPGRLDGRGLGAFATIEIATDQIATTHAFRYRPAPGSVCTASDPTCCYADLYLDFGELMFTSHAHFEYDHYLETAPVGNIGAYFWGSLYFPYDATFVSPALGTGHWYHVTIDGDVSTTGQLVITIDGVERTNSAGTRNLMAGIQGGVGLFCDSATNAGYIDNLMFWGK